MLENAGIAKIGFNQKKSHLINKTIVFQMVVANFSIWKILIPYFRMDSEYNFH